MKSRLLFVLAVLVAWAGLVSARLWELQVSRHGEYLDKAKRQQLLGDRLTGPRGTIFDAAGRELAVSVTVPSAYGIASELPPIAELIRRLEGIRGVAPDRLRRSLAKGDSWVWIARQLDPPVARELEKREIPGVHFREESRRYYPYQRIAAAVLGFVGVDNQGLAGLEALYDDELVGGPVERTLFRDGSGDRLQSPELPFHDAAPGKDLHLTLDATLQHIVERELAAAVARFGARSGTALLLDPRDGAIRAMASVPSFNPNRFDEVPAATWRNRAVMDAYEPGSTFKIVTAAAAFEANLIDPLDVIDCEQGATVVDGIRIQDHRPFGLLTFREVIARSSNVGAIKSGLLVGGPGLWRQIHAFGFGQPTGVDLPGENPGIVRDGRSWRPVETAYASFGQSISVTPLQLALATAAVANGGSLYRPYVVAAKGSGAALEVTRPQEVGRPIGPATARSVERLLEAVVEDGTGKAAAVPGYAVAGKTGTAQVAVNGGYSRERHVASFVGFVPARRPVLLGLVSIDEPRGPLFHGGDVAAPVFAAILRQALPYLGIAPERGAPEPWPGESDLPPVRTAARPAPVAPGTLPDLTGLTARQAVARAAALGVAARLRGVGFVLRQTPAAGTRIAGTHGTVELELGSGPG